MPFKEIRHNLIFDMVYSQEMDIVSIYLKTSLSVNDLVLLLGSLTISTFNLKYWLKKQGVHYLLKAQNCVSLQQRLKLSYA